MTMRYFEASQTYSLDSPKRDKTDAQSSGPSTLNAARSGMDLGIMPIKQKKLVAITQRPESAGLTFHIFF